jgi:hypothetical protein
MYLPGLACIQLKLNHSIKIELSFSKTLIEPVFNIESANISCDEVAKLLGIDIDYQLNFDKHIKKYRS